MGIKYKQGVNWPEPKEMDQGNKNKKLTDSYMYLFLENTDF